MMGQQCESFRSRGIVLWLSSLTCLGLFCSILLQYCECIDFVSYAKWAVCQLLWELSFKCLESFMSVLHGWRLSIVLIGLSFWAYRQMRHLPGSFDSASNLALSQVWHWGYMHAIIFDNFICINRLGNVVLAHLIPFSELGELVFFNHGMQLPVGIWLPCACVQSDHQCWKPLYICFTLLFSFWVLSALGTVPILDWAGVTAVVSLCVLWQERWQHALCMT